MVVACSMDVSVARSLARSRLPSRRAGRTAGLAGCPVARSPACRVLPVCAPVRCWPAGQKDGYASWHVGVRETACSHPRTSTSSCSKVGRVPWPSHGEQLVRFLWVDREQGRGGEIHLRFILPYGNTRATATVYEYTHAILRLDSLRRVTSLQLR